VVYDGRLRLRETADYAMLNYLRLENCGHGRRRRLDRHIAVTPGVAGGKPRIADRRITEQNVVIWHEWMGLSADDIAANYSLSLSDIYAALAYYHDHARRTRGRRLTKPSKMIGPSSRS